MHLGKRGNAEGGSCIYGRGSCRCGIMHLGNRIMQRGDHASREEDLADVGSCIYGRGSSRGKIMLLREMIMQRTGVMHLRNIIMQRGDRKRIMQIK
jgi:hypothetical protein